MARPSPWTEAGPRIRALISTCGIASVLVLLAAPSSKLSAQPEAPIIRAWLYQPYVVVQSESNQRPRVLVYNDEGELLVDNSPTGSQPAGGWRVELADLQRRGFARLLRPGQRVEVRMAGQVSQLELPALEARIEEAGGVIRGRLPEAAGSVALRVHRDANWLDGPVDLGPQSIELGKDGDFEVELRDGLRLSTGWWAEVFASLPQGHVVALGLAPPSLIISDVNPAAYLRADDGRSVYLSLRNRIGTELFRSGAAQPIGPALYRIPLYQDGNPDFGAYRPEEGQQVTLEVDGILRIDEAFPRALASLDAFEPELWGLGTPDARIRLSDPFGDGLVELRAGPQGEFEQALPAGRYGADSAIDMITWPGGAVARFLRATAPSQQILLHDNFVIGSLPGWGELRAELWRGSNLVASEEQVLGPSGEVNADFRRPDGSEPAIQPGDRLRFLPELGRELELNVPELQVQVAEDRRSIYGLAPSDHDVTARLYNAPISILDLQPFARIDQSEVLSARSDASGRYRIDCASEACQANYGIVAASLHSDRYYLYWSSRELAGLGVGHRQVIVRGTAGRQVTMRAFGADGLPRIEAGGRLAPRAQELPAWEQDLADAFAENSELPAGTRLEIDLGEETFEFEVPEMDFEADLRRNAVSGQGPAGRQVAIVAYARGENAAQRGARSAVGQIAADGRWRLQLSGFDLRAGDDLEVYLLDGRSYLWWYLDAVEGPNPTAPLPGRTPEPQPVEPSATPRTLDRMPILLPRLDHGASPSE